MAGPEEVTKALQEALVLMRQRHEILLQRITELQAHNTELLERARTAEAKSGVAAISDRLEAEVVHPRDPRLDDPVGAILFALSRYGGFGDADDGVDFLKAWNEGNSKTLDDLWPEFKAGYGR